jgi:hypothetical protein
MLSKTLRTANRLSSFNMLKVATARGFAAQGVLTDELKNHLKSLGISNDRVVHNPT